MRIVSSVSIPKNDIMLMEKEQIKIQITEHLAQDISRQIVTLVHKEMEEISSPTYEDPFGIRYEFRIEFEIGPSRWKRTVGRNNHTAVISTPYGDERNYFDRMYKGVVPSNPPIHEEEVKLRELFGKEASKRIEEEIIRFIANKDNKKGSLPKEYDKNNPLNPDFIPF